ncbi:MAG: hypothetical protein GC184_04355 [Rhizobiales bacterium]|nr:hypothetical protein [Hyphomicrobiales bacterium]
MMNKRRGNHRLDARVWPDILERLVPATDKRLAEIMDWARANDQQWLFSFLDARAAALLAREQGLAPRAIPPVDYLATRFGLTAAQARVLSAFLGGQSLKEIAQMQGVSITTIRTHFVQIRSKLGARDQVDVVRIALLGGDPDAS